MGKNKFKKFSNPLISNDLKKRLNWLDPMQAYQFNKRNDPKPFSLLTSFLPPGYVTARKDEINSIDFIYSGSTEQPFLLGFVVGRLDTDKRTGEVKYDLDLFHIAPVSGSTDNYLKQFYHFSDSTGKRTSITLSKTPINNLPDKENVLYQTYLTNTKTGFTFEQYEKEKSNYIEYFKQTFKIK